MAKDSTHPQMIKPTDFNYRLKNYLRDFYIYGFKESDPEGDSDFKQKYNPKKGNYNKNEIGSTFSNNLKRLKNCLQEDCKLTWVKQKAKVYCCTLDSRSIENNPFFKIYECCLNSSEAYFLSIIFALSPYIKRNSPKKNVDVNVIIDKIKNEAARRELKRAFEEISKSYQTQRAREAYNLLTREAEEIGYNSDSCFASSDEINNWNEVMNFARSEQKKIDFETLTFVDDKLTLDDGTILDDYYSSEQIISFIKSYGLDELVLIGDRRFNGKLSDLVDLGILDSVFSGGKNWYKLNNTYIKNIVPNETMSQFIDMVKYFSDTAPLGEIGHFLLRSTTAIPTRIRQKHHYIKNIINDYNNIALLCSLKLGSWLKIQYRNAMDLEYQELVCYPLQLRESTIDGRQYLVYYNPLYRSVSALRIEFIDKIELGTYASQNIRKDLILSDIENAKDTLEYLWNTGYDNFKEGNLKTDLKTKYVKLMLQFKQKDHHVKERLLKEKRHGEIIQEIMLDNDCTQIEYGVNVTSFTDMIPWIRSFIERIVSIKIDGVEYETIHKDIEDMVSIYNGDTLPLDKYLEKAPNNKVSINNIEGFIAKDFLEKRARKKDILQEETKESVNSNPFSGYIFNEIYGTYYTEIGKLLAKSLGSDELTDESEIRKVVTDIVNSHGEIPYSMEESHVSHLCEILGKFTAKVNGEKLFEIASISSLFEIVPLSKIERQWLINVLSMTKARLFLSGDEIDIIKDNIINLSNDNDDTIGLFDIKDFKYHDQYADMHSIYAKKDYINIFKAIQTGIKESKILHIKYKNNQLNEYICKIAYLEYSKRDDRFRAYGIDDKSNVIVLNLEKIQEVVILQDTFDGSSILEIINNYTANHKKTVEIMFTDAKNVPDRILTEFSPWEKECLCTKRIASADDNQTTNRLYTLTLKYDDSDAAEIVARLLGYGPYIFIINDDGAVKKRFINKLQKQRNLSREMENQIIH